MSTETPIEWGYNCLTTGIHHGRPEKIWNIPLVYAATTVFRKDQLKVLVVSRIYNDAMQFVEHAESQHNITTPEWAARIKELAEEKFNTQLVHKVGEISTYYRSASWQLEQQDTAHRVTEDKLNPFFEPLHSHDSINMLCRIIGTSCSIMASREIDARNQDLVHQERIQTAKQLKEKGHSSASIAKQMGLSENSVRLLLHPIDKK